MSAIEVRKLTKVFAGGITAVDGIDLDVREGEIFGLLGPNGAGKTTTIRILATMTRPTSGEAKIFDIDVARDPDAVRRTIGIVFQDPALDDQLTGYENLDFHARMYGMRRADREKRIREVLTLVGLADRAHELAEKYSGGMRRRLEIARGLMHYPRVLFLDEPTLGLDTQTRRVIWDHIRSLNELYRITIILTTHYMEEADYLCNRVAIIDHGRILTLDTPANLKESIGGDVVTLRVKDTAGMEAVARSMSPEAMIKVHDSSVSIALANAGDRIPELLKRAENAGIEVESVDLHKPTLEDVFLHYTGATIREHESGAVDRMRMHIRARMRR